MNELGITLHIPWSADEPPPRDVAFVVGVLERMEQRRFKRELLMLVVRILPVVIALVFVAPVIQDLIQNSITAVDSFTAAAVSAVVLAVIATLEAPTLFGIER